MIAGRDALCDGEVVVLALAGRLAAAGRHQIEQLGLHLPRSGRPARSGGAGAGVAQSLMSLMRLMSSRSLMSRSRWQRSARSVRRERLRAVRAGCDRVEAAPAVLRALWLLLWLLLHVL